MKKTKITFGKKLLLNKETVSLLNQEEAGRVAGGGSVNNLGCRATREDACRTLGLAIDLTQCCVVYELSVNLPCNA